MRNLVEIKGTGKDTKFVLVDPSLGKSQDYTLKELLDLKKLEPELMIDGLNFVGDESVNIGTPEEYTSNKLMVLAMLAEGNKETKRVVGYKVYSPVDGGVACLPVNLAVERIQQYGAFNGELRGTDNRRYVYAKVKTEPACKHVGLYLKMYHVRKDKANQLHRPCEKIVRVDKEHLELRGIPTGNYQRMVTPKGLGYINLKWWKVVGSQHMQVQDKPKVQELVLGDMITEIKINEPENDMDLVPKHYSLGAFANWGLETLKLSPYLRTIGKEAFYCNKLTEVTIPATVTKICKRAFMQNKLEKVTFEKRRPTKGKVYQLRIEDDAFRSNPLDLLEYLKLPPVSYIGENAFKGCKGLSSINIPMTSTIKVIKTGSFANTGIEEFWVPNSVEHIEEGAFAGTHLNKLIFSRGTKIKTISRKFADDYTVKIIGAHPKFI